MAGLCSPVILNNFTGYDFGPRVPSLEVKGKYATSSWPAWSVGLGPEERERVDGPQRNAHESLDPLLIRIAQQGLRVVTSGVNPRARDTCPRWSGVVPW